VKGRREPRGEVRREREGKTAMERKIRYEKRERAWSAGCSETKIKTRRERNGRR